MNVQEIIKRATANGGGLTFKADYSAPKSGYMVALTGGLVCKESELEKVMFRYLHDHHHITTGENYYFGLWLKDGVAYLDVSQNIQDKEYAVFQGIARGQKSIYHIDSNKIIDLPTGQKTGTTEQQLSYARQKAEQIFQTL